MSWIERMDEPIEVEARFLADGGILPRAFRWQGNEYEIAAVGRHWTEEGERRFLVMTPDERVFELAFRMEDAVWRLRRTPAAFAARGDAV
jgi:hypothetical protein